MNILSVGFDYPELDTIIIGRPTASLSWYYQFVGRVTRIHPQKTEGLVIDFVGSVPRFGKVEELYFKEDEISIFCSSPNPPYCPSLTQVAHRPFLGGSPLCFFDIRFCEEKVGNRFLLYSKRPKVKSFQNQKSMFIIMHDNEKSLL